MTAEMIKGQGKYAQVNHAQVKNPQANNAQVKNPQTNNAQVKNPQVNNAQVKSAKELLFDILHLKLNWYNVMFLLMINILLRFLRFL